MNRLTLRIDFGDQGAVGPGKIRLLEAIAEHHSISAAGRAMGMSYRRAWQLVDALNQTFAQPSVTTQVGGGGGGGAALTEFGQELVAAYRAMEKAAAEATADIRAGLAGRLRPPGA
ncbi:MULTISPECIES: winged helix-turn-helix domain-containing protein [Nitrospirillum]|uniref:LysR family transcriptional regulator n=2 Tax=Nitrospirillum TaxID=1543705 RepID=A0A248JYT3_9PROT|nr:LysR family transcriptional regulator [Nitrospirillum amazonense]ASG23374.1 LysR family transcriptional regulator [Nitrospirillum amazonense CBAmc]MEC4593677.1 LysR family transcriptional regulator [Nitrospirillum amazonense]TWB25424.1 molybdate transport system regulatory protein [Nitrospirillum amazonense]TWB39947.1 molybdate transport system regulatory protein [Nitrospirillum amazonense]